VAYLNYTCGSIFEPVFNAANNYVLASSPWTRTAGQASTEDGFTLLPWIHNKCNS